MAGKKQIKKDVTLETSLLNVFIKVYYEQIISFNCDLETYIKMIELFKKVNNSENKAQAVLDYNNEIEKIYKDGNYEEKFINNLKKINSDIYEIFAIKHYKEFNTDNAFCPSREKEHFHILVKQKNRKSLRSIKTVLNLLNIKFRPELDETLFKNGVERVTDFNACCVYLIHETQAALKDGNKFLYDVEEVFTNTNLDVYKNYCSLYNKPKLNNVEAADIARLAFEAGSRLESFKDFISKNCDFTIRKSNSFKTIKEYYFDGVNEYIKNNNNNINRCCVFIFGPGNVGKTYNSHNALKKMGLNVYSVDGGGSGSFDGLDVADDAVIVDDYTVGNLLNLSDNRICQVYRRGSNNPFFAGSFLIVTSNLCFESWLSETDSDFRKLKPNSPEYYARLYAFRSRFFICSISENYTLKVLRAATRGDKSEQMERLKKFKKFLNFYNEGALNYSVNSGYTSDELLSFL